MNPSIAVIELMRKNAIEIASPEAFEAEMKKISEIDDSESAHYEADMLMCRVLTELGYAAGVRVFDEEIEKWYS